MRVPRPRLPPLSSSPRGRATPARADAPRCVVDLFVALGLLAVHAAGHLLLTGRLTPFGDARARGELSAFRADRARVHVWVTLAFDVLVARPIAGIASAVCYHDLRTEKQGEDPKTLARVFE